MRDRVAAALEAAVESDDQTRVCTLRLICAAINDRDAGLGADEGVHLGSSVEERVVRVEVEVDEGLGHHSHSIVAGGFEEMS